LARKSIIQTKKMVPEYFANNREFQVFLRAVNLALTVIKSDIDNFIPNLLDPLRCKARLLPLLSNYVGWNYDPTERVETNRWITRLYPLLIRNRGNEIGVTLAVAMAISLMADPDDIDELSKNFSIELDYVYDKYGRKIDRLKIYIYFPAYLSILKDLIEVVRPAGIMVELIPAHSISSDGQTTIVLTDEYSIMKYHYLTGKLLSINDVNIHVQNSWEVLCDEQVYKQYRWVDLEPPNAENYNKYGKKDEYLDAYPPFDWSNLEPKTWADLEDTGRAEAYGAMPGLAPYYIDNKNTRTTGEWLVDGRFVDKYGNDMGKYVDIENGKIMFDTGAWSGETVKETRIFAQNTTTGGDYYTGKYFDVSNPAKVLNTYYQILEDGVFRGFYLGKDDFTFYNENNKSTRLKLKEYEMVINGQNTLVWKVFNTEDVMFNWHVDIRSRKFIKDDVGDELYSSQYQIPFNNFSYIGKKAYLMKVNKITNEFVASSYYVNRYGDVVDHAGNIILSKKDRYKVSDSTMIGFSEVHQNQRFSTYDGTNIMAREWSFMKDDDIQNTRGRDNINDFEEYDRVTDPRYKLEFELFDIGQPIREYTGTEMIRFLSSEELSEIRASEGIIHVPLFITPFDNFLYGSPDNKAIGMLKIKLNLPINFSLGDIFKTMKIRFEKKLPNNELNPKWDVFIDWTANTSNKSLFNLNDLENPIQFFKCGIIEKRTLHWTKAPITLTPKLYDGTTRVYTRQGIVNENNGYYQTIIGKDYIGG